MQRLYKMTTLEDTFSCNFNVLIAGVPRVLGAVSYTHLLFTLHADVPHLAAGEKIGIEECGRKVRYDFFR